MELEPYPATHHVLASQCFHRLRRISKQSNRDTELMEGPAGFGLPPREMHWKDRDVSRSRRLSNLYMEGRPRARRRDHLHRNSLTHLGAEPSRYFRSFGYLSFRTDLFIYSFCSLIELICCYLGRAPNTGLPCKVRLASQSLLQQEGYAMAQQQMHALVLVAGYRACQH